MSRLNPKASDNGKVLDSLAPPGEIAELVQSLNAGAELTPKSHEALVGLLQTAASREPQLLAQITQVAFRQEMYSGPLPHFEQLNGYSEDTQREIVAMAVREQAHEHEMRKTGLSGAIWKDRIGQFLGFGIAVSGLAAAAWISQYSAVAAAIIGTLDLLAMVCAFVAPRAFEKMMEARARTQPQPTKAKAGQKRKPPRK